MKKDIGHYERRLINAQRKRHEPLVTALDAAKSDQEFHKILDEINADSGLVRIERIGVHLNEALAIIRLLLDDPEPEDPAKTYDVLWIDRLSNLMGKGKLMQSQLTRAEMLERLHWISSEEFGEDLDEWTSWMVAFEANPPATGHR